MAFYGVPVYAYLFNLVFLDINDNELAEDDNEPVKDDNELTEDDSWQQHGQSAHQFCKS